MSFKLYDEDAILVEQLADTSSFTNLCTNVFRSHYKSQQEFLRNQIAQLSGEAAPKPETELALIPMPATLWDAYLTKAQAITEATGVDVGCEELMLRVLQGLISSSEIPVERGKS